MSYGYQGPPVAPFQGRAKAPTSFGAPPGTPSAPGAPPYSSSSNIGFGHPPNSFGMPQPYGGYSACPYPSQSQPPQSAPYPGPASGMNTAPYPQQTSPYPVQNTPYPAQNSPYPAHNSPYPAQNSPYPAQNSPYPAQNSPYPAQNSPYPAQNSPYPAQNSPYPPQNSPHPSQNPYPSQTLSYGSHNSPQSSPYQQQTHAYTGQDPQPTSPYPQAPSAQQAYPSGQHSQMNPYPAAPINQTSSISRGSPYPGSANVLSQSANASFPSANNAYSGGVYPGGQGRGGSPYSSRAAASSYTLPQQNSPAPRRAQITRKLSPTVVPYPDFDPRDDAAVLRKAMKGFGTDDKALIHVLANRSNLQRQEIATQFKTLYGKDLIKDLKSETSGNFEKLLVAMMTPLPQYYAKELHDALTCLGTDESVLIEVLCTLSNHEIRVIKQAYEAMYGQPLEDDLIDDTSGNFKRLMVSLCCANRDESFDVDSEQAYNDARDLLQAGELRMGTDESTFNAILVQRSLPQLQQIFACYADITGHDIETAIEREFSGDIKKGLMAIVKCTKNRAGFFAELLYKSMKGFGTNDRRLIRLITTRSEVDLGEIKQAFLQEYGESLESFVSDDCSGNYKACLLALIS